MHKWKVTLMIGMMTLAAGAGAAEDWRDPHVTAHPKSHWLASRHLGPFATSPDGRRVILGSYDETASQWRLDDQLWAERACRIVNRNLDEAEWADYMGDRPFRRICADLP